MISILPRSSGCERLPKESIRIELHIMSGHGCFLFVFFTERGSSYKQDRRVWL